MDKEQINNGADLLARKERLERLTKKYSYRTESERLAPFFNLFKGLGFFLQILSALFAAGGVLMLSAVFSKTFGIVVIMTISLLILLEALKRLSYNEYNRQRNSKENIGKTIVFFCAVFGSLSVGSSFIGARHTIEFFAAKPDLVDTAQINNNYKSKLLANSAYWGKLEKESNLAATQLKEDNTSSKGVTYWHALGTLTEIKKQGSSYKDSLTKYASIIKASNSSAITEATKENKERSNINNDWVKAFGSYSALASLGFEAALFLILFWCSNFEKREIKEAETLTKEPTKEAPTLTKERKPLVKEVVKSKSKEVAKEAPQDSKDASLTKNSIQIIQGKETSKEEIDQPKEGDIIPPIGKQKTGRIWVVLDEGGRLAPCRPCDLNNHIRGNDGERSKYFKKYLETLKNWNDENRKK